MSFLVPSFLSGEAQESEVQKQETGTDTSSVFHHAILHVPMPQPREPCDGPQWFYWSGKFTQQNTCPHAVQQAADLRENTENPQELPPE